MRDLCGFRTLLVLTLLIAGGAPAFAQYFSIYDDPHRQRGSVSRSIYERVMLSEPEELTERNHSDDILLDQSIAKSKDAAEVPAQFRRQVVSYPTREPVGTIVIDTPNTYLYYVLGGGQAIRYGIGVGRDGFSWSGVRAIERKTEWPDWIPPAEMLERQPDLPRWMAGGPGNPLGARAMYLSGTLYRIHGTSQPTTIGQRVSSGCIRMLNEDVIELFDRVQIGTRVVVQPDSGRRVASNAVSNRNSGRMQRDRTPAIAADRPEIAVPAVTVLQPLRLD